MQATLNKYQFYIFWNRILRNGRNRFNSTTTGNAFVSKDKNWGLKSPAGQIRHSVANGLPPLGRCEISLKGAVLLWRNGMEVSANLLNVSV